MIKHFDVYRKKIEQYLNRFLLSKGKELGQANQWGIDVTKRLFAFSTKGKLLRGSLLLFSGLMFDKETEKPALEIASAYELIHSSLLIHDDIMDRDTQRRGMPSVFYQYKNRIEDENGIDPYHTGVSLGICAGDLAIFLSFEILSQAKLDPLIKQRILHLWSRELSLVGIAQMQDVSFGASYSEPEEEEILSLYRYKTARYTFSIPLISGAILARQDQSTINILEKIGEWCGMIFQLKDDELGLFGDEVKLGKPVGTDVEEHKKTLIMHYLHSMLKGEDKRRLDTIQKKGHVTASDLEFIRTAAEKTQVNKRVQRKMLDMKKKTEGLISKLDVKDEYKHTLFDLLGYSLSREW
ncbi:MAG: polyprenyl synthetase family protein [Spirochaetota bacterium]|nr:MAG: polyprenyl synthetase family protein [Spirochaetota bacterium]